MTTNNEIHAIIKQRGNTYGDFRDNGSIAQAIKDIMRESPGWNSAPSYLREGLDMIALKVSRILSGDPLYPDNLIDIAGYATRCLQIVDEDYGRRAPAHAGMTTAPAKGDPSPASGDPIPDFLAKRTPEPKPDPRRRDIDPSVAKAVMPDGAEDQ